MDDTMYSEAAKRADIKEYILFCAAYQFILVAKC